MNIIQQRDFASKLIFLLTFMLIAMLAYTELNSKEKEETADTSKKSPKVISFSKDIQPILTKNCAVEECHVVPKPTKKLILSEGVAYKNIVNVVSRENSKKKIVAPGNLELSYLYDKLTGNQADGDRMPSGKKALPKEKIELIKKWILDGAPGDSMTAVTKDSAERKVLDPKKSEKKID